MLPLDCAGIVPQTKRLDVLPSLPTDCLLHTHKACSAQKVGQAAFCRIGSLFHGHCYASLSTSFVFPLLVLMEQIIWSNMHVLLISVAKDQGSYTWVLNEKKSTMECIVTNI